MAKYTGWKNFPTIQFREIIAELEDAKEEQKAIMIIAPTGSGKTNAINAFKAKNKDHTYVFTLGDSYNLPILLNEVLAVFGFNIHHWKNMKHIALRKISQHLTDLHNQGHRPVFILDEAENARIPMLKAVKELYDAIVGKCGIVLIGTDQLIGQLTKKSHGQSIPQLRRRFKAGTRFIAPFNKAKDMNAFFNEFIPGNEDLKDLLIQICDNYGELHDYLHPFLVSCEKKKIAATVDNFRMYHKIPKIK